MYLVEATRPEVPVDDLGITVRQGAPVWVTEEDFRDSLCLRHLARLGAIRVSSGERSRVTKKPPRAKAQVARLSRPRKKGEARPPAKAPPSPVAPPHQAVKVVRVGIPAEEVNAMIQRAATEASRKTAEAILARLPVLAAPATPASAGKAPAPLPAAPEEPMFIPAGIVTDEKADLHLKSESSDAEGVEDAAAALKALRKREKE